jgi:hypothetical protein
MSKVTSENLSGLPFHRKVKIDINGLINDPVTVPVTFYIRGLRTMET